MTDQSTERRGPDRSGLARIWTGFWRVIAPARCCLCGMPGWNDLELCQGCLGALPRHDHACIRCQAPAPRASAAPCGRCQKHPPHFDALFSPVAYAHPVDLMIHRFKFAGDLAMGRSLAGIIRDADPPGIRSDAVVPVPLHRWRYARRGFNQAEELARHLCRDFACPLGADLLRRVRATPAQSRLDAKVRRRNLAGSFRAVADLSGLRLVLVDDVVTTGSTVNECARALKRAGALEVLVWAIARA